MDGSVRPLKCDVSGCGIEFADKKELRVHRRSVHQGAVRTNYRQFIGVSSDTEVVISRGDDGKFKCINCTYSTSNAELMTQHAKRSCKPRPEPSVVSNPTRQLKPRVRRRTARFTDLILPRK